MARYVVVHTPLDAKVYAGETFGKFAAECIEAFTKQVYCITTWQWGGGTNAVCLWEAPNEQALIEFFAARKTMQPPVNGIYPVTVTDWAEVAKSMSQE